MPQVSSGGDDSQFGDLLKRSYQGEEPPILRGTVREKVWANADDRTFGERRNTEWSRYNWRPRTAWKRLEEDKGNADARAELVRRRNRDATYGGRKEKPRTSNQAQGSNVDKEGKR